MRVQGMVERAVPAGRRSAPDRTQSRADGDAIDAKFGFERIKDVST